MLAGLRVGVAQGLPLENLDDTVGKRFPEALDRLEKAGARLAMKALLIDDMVRSASRASTYWWLGLYAIHRDRLARRGDDIDPIVRARVEKGRDYIGCGLYRAGAHAGGADPRHGCKAR